MLRQFMWRVVYPVAAGVIAFFAAFWFFTNVYPPAVFLGW